MHVEKFVEPQPGGQVQQSVEKGIQPEHPPKADPSLPARDPAQWGDGQRDQQKTQRPIAGRVGDDLDRVRAQIALIRLQPEQRQRHQRGQEYRDFEEFHFQGSDNSEL